MRALRTFILGLLLAGVESAAVPPLNRGFGFSAVTPSGGGGATLLFDYSSGFAGSPAITLPA